MIQVLINDRSKELNNEITITDLLKELAIHKNGTAVAVNDCVVPRSKHDTHKISDGDRLEIIMAVGGG